MQGYPVTGEETATVGNITRAVGRLEGIVASMAKNADDDREYLRSGFGRIHERLDKQSEELASIKFAVETGAKIDAQVRGELNEVKANIAPLIRRDTMLRWALGVVVAAAGMSGITVAMAREAVRGAVLSWLGIIL